VVATAVGVSGPHNIRDAANTSTEWPAWDAQSLTRIASQFARTLDLSHQVLQRVARGELTPAAIDDALRELARARGEEYTDRLSQLAERFTSGLVEVMTAGGVDRPSPDRVHQITRLYADLLGGFNDLRAGQIEDCLRTLLTSATATVSDPSRALVLVASLSGTASTALIVENEGTERIAIHCVASDVRRADGVGPAFVPEISLTPDGQTIEPGQEGRVLASLRLDAAVYESERLYVGALRVMGERGPRLEVPLHIMATRGAR